MKSPAEIASRLARQWQQAQLREERLLNVSAWPLRMPIGKPSARGFEQDTAAVHEHVLAWRKVPVGEVFWEPVSYRAGAEPIRIPTYWILRTPSEWVEAVSDTGMRGEFRRLEHIIENVDEAFRRVLVRQRGLWRDKPDQDVIAAARLAARLSPGCAGGRPLRLMAEFGVDTKFFERHGGLLTRFLDERFDGLASERGLVVFLGALEEKEHWLLVAPLDDGILPFRRLRVTSEELTAVELPADRILVVENERCLHLLPRLPNTVAILGAGRDLSWMGAEWLAAKRIAYWGDLDSWGLVMLAEARRYQPDLTPLMMDRAIFDRYEKERAVVEVSIAGDQAPAGLTDAETAFYLYLIARDRGRLEQEYLPDTEVLRSLSVWTG
ncbi:DUF3322 domain-containing protein [Alloalcanivorax xenomutans]|uniref:DUF3322 domain-containing protein n=1 Tax=Alloalcanivorax xenomutans TaxID=1094342 RepID=UPI0024E25522|nr:DUF3322 domain-containing protein [Alloalcanivorax xenomutans]